MRSLRLIQATLLAALLLAGSAQAAEKAGDITMLTGRATAATQLGDIRSLRKDGYVYPGEIINTGPNTYLNIKFTDGGRMLLRPNTRFQIAEYRYSEPRQARRRPQDRNVEQQAEGNALFRLLKGGFRAVTGLIGRENREDYKVRTPVATIGIRGTDFEARLCAGDCFDIDPLPQDGLYAGVLEGGIVLQNNGGTIERGAGQYGFVGGFSQPPQGTRRRPKALSQDPMPDPEACE